MEELKQEITQESREEKEAPAMPEESRDATGGCSQEAGDATEGANVLEAVGQSPTETPAQELITPTTNTESDVVIHCPISNETRELMNQTEVVVPEMTPEKSAELEAAVENQANYVQVGEPPQEVTGTLESTPAEMPEAGVPVDEALGTPRPTPEAPKKTPQQLNEEAAEARRKMNEELMKTSFSKIKSKHWDRKLDLMCEDYLNLKETLEKKMKRLENIVASKSVTMATSIDMLIETLHGVRILNKPEFVKAIEAETDRLFGYRKLSEGEQVVFQDQLIIDFEGFDEAGNPGQDMKAEGYNMVLNFQSLLFELERELMGMKVGEERTKVQVVFPNEYPEKGVAGKTYYFNLKVKSAKRTPESDEKVKANLANRAKMEAEKREAEKLAEEKSVEPTAPVEPAPAEPEEHKQAVCTSEICSDCDNQEKCDCVAPATEASPDNVVPISEPVTPEPPAPTAA